LDPEFLLKLSSSSKVGIIKGPTYDTCNFTVENWDRSSSFFHFCVRKYYLERRKMFFSTLCMTEQERAANFKGMLAKLGTKFSKKNSEQRLAKMPFQRKKRLAE
jgi:hypothetical protein